MDYNDFLNDGSTPKNYQGQQVVSQLQNLENYTHANVPFSIISKAQRRNKSVLCPSFHSSSDFTNVWHL